MGEPDQIRSFADNKFLLTWALQLCTVDTGWILLRPFSCSKGELKTLSDTVGEIPPLKYDFQSATVVFYHLKNFHRFTTPQMAELNAAIIAKSDTFEQTLRSYFPEATGDPIYKVWTQWANLGFAAWVYFRQKTHWANQVFIRYRPYKTGVDNLLQP